jgi:hypothetical protein
LKDIKVISVSLFSDHTIWQLKKILGQLIEISPNYLKITKQDSQLDYTEQYNGRTIADMYIKNEEIFQLRQVDLTSVPKAMLIDSEGNMHPRFENILREQFILYSNDLNLMDKENSAAFTKKVTREHCSVHDERVRRLF